jgi:transposase
MRRPDEVDAMLRLHGLGWGYRRIARELGCSRVTVRRYVMSGGWSAFRRAGRPRKLAAHMDWVTDRFRRHRGNADVVRQDLARELGIEVSLRTLERAVAPLRRALAVEARATLRFETPPGKQLQIDFGEARVAIGGELVTLHLFVATLGYSRRLFVRAFRHERQSAWFDGLEAAFGHFGGVPQELLLDNPRALVDYHDAATREVRFNARFTAFCRHWDVRPRACAPYRARTKGKDERGVGYVKHNAIAGHCFPSWAGLEAHLLHWMRAVADVRRHGTTEEAPGERFTREEAAALRPLSGRPPFNQVRNLVRKVTSECTIELDANSYSVPWRLIGEQVQVVVGGGRVQIHHAGAEIASHAEVAGRRQRVLDPAHFHGVTGVARPGGPTTVTEPPAAPELLRPLAEYERAVGGAWS